MRTSPGAGWRATPPSPILAFAYSFWMIYGAGQEYIAQGFLLLMAGIPVYVYIKWRNAKNAAEAAQAIPTGAYR